MKRVKEGAGELVAIARLICRWPIMRSMRLRARYMRLFQRILALRLDLGGMQERMPASCRLARAIGDWYLRKIEKQPNEVQTI
jgi:hypothetical protein